MSLSNGAHAATASALLSAFFLGAPAAADSISLRIGSGHPVGALAYTRTAHDFFAPELKRRIEEQTEHTVVIQEFHAGQIAKVTEVLEATRDGLLDIGFTSLIFEPSNGFMQTFSLYTPFSSHDAAIVTEAGRATFQKFPELSEAFEKEHNQVYLGGACLANYGVGTNFGWNTFADLQGHKIAGAGVNLDWIAGATPVASNLNEAYQSIQSGVYEGYLSASSWWVNFKLFEVAPYFTKTDFGAQYVNMVSVNLDTWNRLPVEVQDILVELGHEWGDETARVCNENESSGLDTLRAAGVDVKEINADAREAWAAAIADFPGRMATEAESRGHAGSEIIGFYIKAISERGHKWPADYGLHE